MAFIYFASVVLLQEVLRSLTGSDSELAVVLSTLAIAALFTPLRRSVQSFIDRRFYRPKYDAAKALAAFSSIARNEVDLKILTDQLIAVVEETIQPEHVSLWLSKSTRRE